MRVTLLQNPLEKGVDYDVLSLDELRERIYGDVWPQTMAFYEGQPSEETRLPTATKEALDRLLAHPGPLTAIQYPKGPVGIVLGIVAILSVLVSFLLPKPKAPEIRQRNRSPGSPNNGLGERGNRPRPGERIAEMFGTNRSYPDEIQRSYRRYEGHREFEIAYDCVGVGQYAVNADDVKDGDTRISDITGAKVEIYPPYTSPNSGSPDLTIGGAIGIPVFNVRESESVDGQELRAPNADQVQGSNNIKLDGATGQIVANGSSDIDFTAFFAVDDNLPVTGAVDGGLGIDLSGTYVAAAVAEKTITLDNPAAVNADWTTLGSGETAEISPLIKKSAADRWIGWFNLEQEDRTTIVCNFVANNGLYKDDGSNQYQQDVVVEVAAQELDGNGDPTGPIETQQATVEGSAQTADGRAVTMEMVTSFTGPCRVRARRVTDKDFDFNGTVVDEVKWERLYSFAPVTKSEFGNVTTAMWQTRATPRALAVRSRKGNMIAQRMLPAWDSQTQTFGALTATNSFADAIVYAALDPYNGNMSLDEVDVDSFFQAEADVIAHFGDAKYAEFSATFDDENESFEEMAEKMAGAAFCVVYRDASGKLACRFDGLQQDATYLFNHRNISPGTQKLADRFGPIKDHDGIEFEYTDREEDTRETLTYPDTGTIVNPKKIDSVGIRDIDQAWSHLRREWGRARYQTLATEIRAMPEADAANKGDKILIANTTQTPILNGDIIGQDGFTLTLSQDVDWPDPPALAIWLQLNNGTTEPIDITLGSEPNEVILAQAPSVTLALPPDVEPAKYLITAAEEADDGDGVAYQAFTLETKEPDGNPDKSLGWNVGASIYDSRVFANDGLAAHTANMRDAKTAGVVARMSSTPSVYQQESIDQFLFRIGDVFDKMDLFYLVGHDEQASLLNWPNTSFDATNSGGSVLTPFVDWSLDGIDDSFDTGYDGDADNTNYVLNSASALLWMTAFTEGDDEYAFGSSGSTFQLRPKRLSSGFTRSAINGPASNIDPLFETPAGFHALSRTDAASYRVYYQAETGSLLSTDVSINSTALPTGEIFVGRLSSNYASMKFHCFALGAGLTDAEIMLIRKEVAAYMRRCDFQT